MKSVPVTSMNRSVVNGVTSVKVPLIIGGSLEIPNMELELCQTVDITPTLLDLLGIKPDLSVIGNSLINKI